jgi:geranylgeranyl reductase family protein
MKNPNTYDVVIVGSGPAGSFLGYLLATQTLKVLVVEKENLPRHKPCGGGLTKRSLSILPFDIGEVIEGHVFSCILRWGTDVIVKEPRNDPVITMVMRDRFDQFLVKKAIDAGATLCQGRAFESLSGKPGDLQVETSGGPVRARILVGADGVRSTVSKALGLWTRRDFVRALVGEVFYPEADVPEEFKNRAYFDFGVIPNGFGWIFPKKGRLSMGALSIPRGTVNLRDCLDAYISKIGLDRGAELEAVREHPLPSGPVRKNSVANQMGLLVGDAAGLVDPVTGEGIYYALREAEIASGIILDWFNMNGLSLEKYNSAVEREFAKELKYAARVAYLIYRIPDLSYKIFQSHGPKLGAFYLEILTGKGTYRELFSEFVKISSIIPSLLKLRS